MQELPHVDGIRPPSRCAPSSRKVAGRGAQRAGDAADACRNGRIVVLVIRRRGPAGAATNGGRVPPRQSRLTSHRDGQDVCPRCGTELAEPGGGWKWDPTSRDS
jgi:hypothetical protein